MTRPARADDYEDEETPVEALTGHVQSAGGTDELAGLLLEIVAAVTKAAVLLGELDADEYAHVAPRVSALLRCMATVPLEGRPRRKLGFAVQVKAKRKEKRK